ncbi:hydrogenase formation protein HypD [Paracraurococcus lichenis]|uniref:Hydrogenase maturation factor n=1 Tax=Paracraurococcus lichenis TaxID=3064888 RepID=A0ABT9DZK4_9PROT|nr:hydrogenase formation protein HypD [Paracraurococcus sp. LOR1-02]MDO9709319.1 hydrogenase formation protein HypD [Paracraurococcus sp. LOR1-02]
MRYVEEYRDPGLARRIAAALAAEADPARRYRLMEFCGGHTHAICRYGLEDLLPRNVELIHGPGCPVCVLPVGRLDMAIDLALSRGVILCTFGDMMRVPGRDRRSLMRAKAEGADIRMVLGSADALRLARENPGREVVFFAIGFETTAPTTAVALLQAAAEGLRNFSVFCNHVLTPAAIAAILAAPETGEGRLRIDGFIGPGHVSTIIGSGPYEVFAALHRRPIVVAGFEPLDLMQAVLMLVRQMNEGRAAVETQFARAVTREGNRRALDLLQRVFVRRDGFEWRGLGHLPDSALAIAPDYAAFDAERRFGMAYQAVPDHKACACAEILRGVKKPADCRIFGTACTPDMPMGSCMVSPEGSCAAYYSYGRARMEAGA